MAQSAQSSESQGESEGAEPAGTDTTGTGLMSLRGAVFLGIGAMVGAGIFALLGEAGAIAGAAVWISFLVAGLISLTLGYAMVKLGTHYPSAGGLITYLIKGFGNGRLVGIASWLGYVTAIVVVGAMVAVSFGDYAADIFFGDGPGTTASKVFASALVLVAAWLCVIGPRMVDRAQSVIVVLLLAVFAVFVVVTLTHLDLDLLAPSGYPSVRSIVSSVALTFFAYLGFAVISFAAGDLRAPHRNLGRAMYLALGITMVLYVAIAIGVFGTLPVHDVIRYGPTAIAEAARPTLGDAGFAAMAIAALLATSSSVTATLYASEGLTSTLADVGQFPRSFGRSSRLGHHGGLVITTVLTLLFVTVFSLGALASIGSAVSLAVFMLVGVAALRLRHTIGGRAWIIVAGVVASAAVLVVFSIDTFDNDKKAFWTMVLLPFVALGADLAWRRFQSRHASNHPAM